MKKKAKSVKATKLKKGKRTKKGAIRVSGSIGGVKYTKYNGSSKYLSMNKKDWQDHGEEGHAKGRQLDQGQGKGEGRRQPFREE